MTNANTSPANADKLSGQAWQQSKTASDASAKIGNRPSSTALRTAADAHQKAADLHSKAADAHSEGAMNKKGVDGSDHWNKNQAHRTQASSHMDQAKQLCDQADTKAQYEDEE